MHSELVYSLKEYLISQSVIKNHYPFKYWSRNKNLFIHLSFWTWIIWIFITLFSIFLPVSNQQKLGRGAIVVFETVFQYIVRILGSHRDAPENMQEASSLSPAQWNYEAYMFMYLTVILVVIGGYSVYLIRNFLQDLDALIRKTNTPRLTRIRFVIFSQLARYFWFFCLLLTAWTAFALLYVRKPTSYEINTFLYETQDANISQTPRIYHRELTTTGWVTAGLNIFESLVIIVLYLKYSREIFRGNQFFFSDLRMKEEASAQVFIDPEISRAISKSLNISGKTHYGHPNSPGYVCELSNVNKYFYVKNGIFHALKDINLNIEDGDFVVILGYSGSGKTTLLNILAGIDRPTEGKCIISDCDTTKMSDYDLNLFRRRKIGYIFQNYALLPNLTASENIAIVQGMNKPSLKELLLEKQEAFRTLTDPMEKMDFIFRSIKELFFTKANRKEVDEIMETLNLTEHKDKYPHTLSGGQQQRVAVARALVKKPDILLADEPTGAIDHAMTKSILTLFYNVNTYAKTTVILITHNPLIAQMAKRVLHVDNGEIVKDVRNAHPLHPTDIKGL